MSDLLWCENKALKHAWGLMSYEKPYTRVNHYKVFEYKSGKRAEIEGKDGILCTGVLSSSISLKHSRVFWGLSINCPWKENKQQITSFYINSNQRIKGMKSLIVLPRGKKGVTYPGKVFPDKNVLLLFWEALGIKPRVFDMLYKRCSTEQISLFFTLWDHSPLCTSVEHRSGCLGYTVQKLKAVSTASHCSSAEKA